MANMTERDILHSIFAQANTGLISHGGIYTCLGVIHICYTQYKLYSFCECVMSVIVYAGP